MWEADHSCCGNFADEMKWVFHQANYANEQDRKCFTLSAISEWGKRALFDTFFNGLSDDIKVRS